jgi:hypothetical protein
MVVVKNKNKNKKKGQKKDMEKIISKRKQSLIIMNDSYPLC